MDKPKNSTASVLEPFLCVFSRLYTICKYQNFATRLRFSVDYMLTENECSSTRITCQICVNSCSARENSPNEANVPVRGKPFMVIIPNTTNMLLRLLWSPVTWACGNDSVRVSAKLIVMFLRNCCPKLSFFSNAAGYSDAAYIFLVGKNSYRLCLFPTCPMYIRVTVCKRCSHAAWCSRNGRCQRSTKSSQVSTGMPSGFLSSATNATRALKVRAKFFGRRYHAHAFLLARRVNLRKSSSCVVAAGGERTVATDDDGKRSISAFTSWMIVSYADSATESSLSRGKRTALTTRNLSLISVRNRHQNAVGCRSHTTAQT